MPEETKKSLIERWWPAFAAGASGVWLALCFPPWDFGKSAFLALTPLLSALWLPQEMGGWRRFRLGWLCGFVFATASFWWLRELAPLFDNALLNTLPVLLGAAIGVFTGAFGWFVGWFTGSHMHAGKVDPFAPDERPPLLSSARNLGIGAVVAAAWVALEWARAAVLWGFNWNTLGVALHGDFILVQIADVTGAAGLSFAVVLCNAIAVITVLRLRAEVGRVRLRPHFDFIVAVALVVGIFSYGVRALTQGQPGGPARQVKVAAVQTGIPQVKKMDADFDDETVGLLERLTAEAAKEKPDVVLWPEAAVPGGMFGSADSEKWLRDQAAVAGVLLLGSDDFKRGGGAEDFNGAVLVTPDETQVYDKIHLVPFGEYLPLRPLLGWALDGLIPGDFTPGAAPVQMELPGGTTLGPLICFEDTQPYLSRAHATRRAGLFVNLTNDAWFGRTGALEQHLANARFRCIESRIPMVRCTNTGVTCSIDAFGKIDRWLPPHAAAVAHRSLSVPVNPPPTFFTRNGDVVSPACAVIAALAGVGCWWRRRRRAVREI